MTPPYESIIKFSFGCVCDDKDPASVVLARVKTKQKPINAREMTLVTTISHRDGGHNKTEQLNLFTRSILECSSGKKMS